MGEEEVGQRLPAPLRPPWEKGLGDEGFLGLLRLHR